VENTFREGKPEIRNALQYANRNIFWCGGLNLVSSQSMNSLAVTKCSVTNWDLLIKNIDTNW
jgi:hypothetical protein